MTGCIGILSSSLGIGTILLGYWMYRDTQVNWMYRDVTGAIFFFGRNNFLTFTSHQPPDLRHWLLLGATDLGKSTIREMGRNVASVFLKG